MFTEGNMVKVVSCEKGISKIFINKIGIIDQIKPKEYYKYHINFRNKPIDIEGEYFWWADENLEIFSEFTTGIQDFIGERSSAFEEKMNEAKEFALDKIRQKAYLLGGDAVIGLDFNYASFDANRVAVIISGTVVKLMCEK